MQPERSLLKNFWITAAVLLVSHRCTRLVSRLFRKYVHHLTYSLVTLPTAPHTEINEKGEIVYSKVNWENVRKLEAYVEEMVSTDHIPGLVNIQKI